jgi:hypothetical protein
VQPVCIVFIFGSDRFARPRSEKKPAVTVTVTPLFWLANVSGFEIKRSDTYLDPHFGAQVAVAYQRYSLVGQLVTAKVDTAESDFDTHARRYDGDLIAGYSLSPFSNERLYTTLGLGYKFIYANSDFSDSRNDSQTLKYHFATFNTGFLYRHQKTSTLFPVFNVSFGIGHRSLSNPDPNERRSGTSVLLVPDVGLRWQANPYVTLLLSYKTQWFTFVSKTGKNDEHGLIHGPQIGLVAKIPLDGLPSPETRESGITVVVTPLFWLANVSGFEIKRSDTYLDPHFGAQVAVAYQRYSLVGQLVTAKVDTAESDFDTHARRYDGDLIAGYSLSPFSNERLYTTLGLGYKFIYANSDFSDSRNDSQTLKYHFATFNTGFLYRHQKTSTLFPVFNVSFGIGHRSLSNPDPNERRSGTSVLLVPDVGLRWQANPYVTLLLSYKTQWFTFVSKTGKNDEHGLIHGPQIGLVARF